MRHWLRRRAQVVVTSQGQKQQAEMARAAVRKLAARTIAALAREQAAINEAIHVLIKQHGTRAVRSNKGLGPVF